MDEAVYVSLRAKKEMNSSLFSQVVGKWLGKLGSSVLIRQLA